MKVTLTTSAGTEEMSFESFLPTTALAKVGGRRRNPANRTYTSLSAAHLIDRGYTGHEHLEAFGLINMPACRSFSEGRNGRMYDPLLGRFLSPDIVLQNASNTQNYNSYSYCLNNPLRYTDPSGYILIDYSETSPDDPGGALNSNLAFFEYSGAYLSERAFNLQMNTLFDLQMSYSKWANSGVTYDWNTGNYVNNAGHTVSIDDALALMKYNGYEMTSGSFQDGTLAIGIHSGLGLFYEIGKDGVYTRVYEGGLITTVDLNNKTVVTTTAKSGDGWVSETWGWMKDHFYVGAEGEITYGGQLALSLKNGWGFNISPKHEVVVAGSISNQNRSIINVHTGNGNTVYRHDYGLAYFIGVNYNQAIDYSRSLQGNLIHNVSIGAFGVIGFTLTFNEQGQFIGGYGGFDISGKLAIGWGASGSLKLGFTF